MVSHLSQIVAVEKDVKEKAAHAISQAQRTFGNAAVFSGIARTYTPLDEQGERLPPESTRVRYKVKDVLVEVESRLSDLFNVIATKDYTNRTAKADIVIDGKVLLSDVPATTLLFLEKQLGELAALVKSIPTLDATEEWAFDQAQDCWATPPTETMRTRKDKKSKNVFEGNQHHPPQFIVWDEDVPQGRWRTVKYSGALPVSEQNAILARIEKAHKAVKYAREEANRTEAKQQDIAAPLLRYLLG